MASVELEGEYEMEGFEPFLYNEEAWNALAEEEMERCHRKKEEEDRKEAEKERRAKAHKEVRDSIIEYDPKAGCKVFTRFFLRDFSVFDINEMSPICPMRYADSKFKDEFGLEDSANILSISIISSDEGFPVNVYGSVIARDSIDYKCIDLFHRLRDDCQPINLEGRQLAARPPQAPAGCSAPGGRAGRSSREAGGLQEGAAAGAGGGMLVLTGPGRGLVLVDFIYLEIDLKIKKAGVYPDKQFSKGLITIDGRVLSREKDVVVKSEILDSFRSSVEVRFATVLNAVEATFEIELASGVFDGKILAGISGFHEGEAIAIYDSEVDGVVTCPKMIKLRRRVMTVSQSSRMLKFYAWNKAGGIKEVITTEFTPLRPGSDARKFLCGDGELNVKVVWSLMDFRP